MLEGFFPTAQFGQCEGDMEKHKGSKHRIVRANARRFLENWKGLRGLTIFQQRQAEIGLADTLRGTEFRRLAKRGCGLGPTLVL